MDLKENKDQRYDVWHVNGTVRFYLEGYTPNQEECRYLLLKILEQAVRDYISLRDSDEPEIIAIWQEARDFLFDDGYYIQWGESEMNLSEILTHLDLDAAWFRDRTLRRLEESEHEDE